MKRPWTALGVVITAGVAFTACSNDNPEPDLPSGPPVGHWAPMATPEPGLSVVAHQRAWTGQELLIWSGHGIPLEPCNLDQVCRSGQAYNPTTNRWRQISWDGAPAPRASGSGTWTGTQFVVWGGGTILKTIPDGGGGRYDPVTDSWSTMAASPLAGRTMVAAVWTGKEVLYWGGRNPSGDMTFQDGALYDPKADSWRPMSQQNSPEHRQAHTVIWTGSEFIVWGGYVPALPSVPNQWPRLGDGFAYNPESDQWRTISNKGAPSPRAWPVAVWTGQEMLILGGWGSGDRLLRDAAAYNPVTDSWRSLKSRLPNFASLGYVWTGAKVLAWGLLASGSSAGAVYDAAADEWKPMTQDGQPTTRQGPVLAWTGREMIAWGGQTLHYQFWLTDGARFSLDE